MDKTNISENDDFEFKPLTEGLGFHQKKSTGSPLPSKPLVQFKSDMPEIELNSPLPRSKKNKSGKDSAPLKNNFSQHSSAKTPALNTASSTSSLNSNLSLNSTKTPTGPVPSGTMSASIMTSSMTSSESDLQISPPDKNKKIDFALKSELEFDLKKSKNSTVPSSQTVDEILKTLNTKKKSENLSIIEKIPDAPGKTSDSTSVKSNLNPQTQPSKSNETHKPAAWEVAASLLDAMLIVAATLLCLIFLLVITRVDLFSNIYNPDPNGMIYLSLVALVATISWIYLVCNRVFLGYTPGEWVFDQRLGTPEDMNTTQYALKTAYRSALVIFTGFIIFPMISFAMNDDILGKVTGLRLFKKGN